MKSDFNFGRRTFTALVLGAALIGVVPTPAMAYDEASTSSINVNKQNVAISGYDPVAYFTDSQATKGDKKYSASHSGATYYFASAKNRDTFKANPGKYEPQYGGFCAMGVALGKKLDVEPDVWKIVDGKLYLNVNRDVAVKMNEDLTGNLVKAEANWPAIKDKAPKSL
ncbi:YHS domain-containing (seleno)protein [Dechloromonas sp.]|uniref:YHS domain-containing (seleno)protein n=1 Tax=Dechloromonas sp. TaxID=1917218 RepID=UPI00286E1207|nr:YHS domain-containing (seleno)protein [Dechloromonas sp.]